MKRTKAFLAALLCAVTLTGCADQSTGGIPAPNASAVSSTVASGVDALWENATYKEDAAVGEGAHNVKIEVKIGEKSVMLDVKSDKDNLADILTENGIVEGDNSAYGLYIKKVNGVSADYDADGAYWGVCKDGAPTPTGVSSITVKDGERYELVYTLADAEQPAA